MQSYDIIGDIHGCNLTLVKLLTDLGRLGIARHHAVNIFLVMVENAHPTVHALNINGFLCALCVIGDKKMLCAFSSLS